MDWQQWTALNRMLMDEWQALLSSNPGIASAPPAPAPTPNASAPENADLQTFLALSDDILATFETGRGCVRLSPNWERLSGAPVARALGSEFYRYMNAEHGKSFIAALQEAASGNIAETPFFFQLRRPNAAWRWYTLVIGRTRKLASGQHEITCLLKDAQTQKDADARVERTRREAEQALQARSEFLNAVSHELRTPLNAILGFTQIMESGMYGHIESPQYRDYLSHIRESGYELLAQIDELMEMACIEGNNAALHREGSDLADLLQQATTLHRHHILAAQIQIDCEVMPGNITLYVDRVKLQHCISHIIANAVRYSQSGSRVAISAECNDNGELCITIADQGLGMSARRLQTVVSALQRDDSWTSRQTLGLGIGLPLAQELARLHGGYLTLESKAGAGTRVSIHLPGDCIMQRTSNVLMHPALAAET